MSASSGSAQQQPAPRKVIGEWFWRFLAVVMIFCVAWVVWISYQLNPAPLATPAAFAAAAKARASRSTEGVIAPAPPPAQPAAEAPKSEAAPADAAPKQPPVNVEKLRLSDSIATPIPEPSKKR